MNTGQHLGITQMSAPCYEQINNILPWPSWISRSRIRCHPLWLPSISIMSLLHLIHNSKDERRSIQGSERIEMEIWKGREIKKQNFRRSARTSLSGEGGRKLLSCFLWLFPLQVCLTKKRRVTS